MEDGTYITIELEQWKRDYLYVYWIEDHYDENKKPKFIVGAYDYYYKKM